MIMKSHRRDAAAAHADRDASELFAFATHIEAWIRRDRARHGTHKRYARIHRSYRALIRELSLKLDPENDMSLR